MMNLFSSFRIIPSRRREEQPCQGRGSIKVETKIKVYPHSRYLNIAFFMRNGWCWSRWGGRCRPRTGDTCRRCRPWSCPRRSGRTCGSPGTHMCRGTRPALNRYFFIYFYYLSKIRELLFFRENKLNILFFWENYCTDGRCWIELAMLLDQKVERILETEQKCFK